MAEKSCKKIKNSTGKTIVGIDVGGSTTKIVGFDPDGRLLSPIFVQATDPVTSVYGALGRLHRKTDWRSEISTVL